MADERIIELDAVTDVPADAYLVIDSPTQGTKKILPIKIGATYTIQDGDHSFTLVGSNGYSHTVDIPYDSVSMTQAEYNALTPAQKADGTARFITDAESDVESELWSKVGRQTLDTEAQVLSNAVNELKGSIDTNTDDISTNTNAISELESGKVKWKDVTYTITASSAQYYTYYYYDIPINTLNLPSGSVLLSAFIINVGANYPCICQIVNNSLIRINSVTSAINNANITLRIAYI